ncbi:hypothetical protein FH972_003029 [Carpinus fangiana]|uniref:RING-type E3 ubiquitin transferase n=1 Tax=Carpinus fangiana TaxID=176857 RepID=A0A5N6QH59_9ROSI|nr:hypothetical protein FH972_003029 [Carpinus fangiana]
MIELSSLFCESYQLHITLKFVSEIPNPWPSSHTQTHKSQMDDVPSLLAQPPPPSAPKPHMPMLYYGLLVIGTAALLLAIYNLLIIRWCTQRRQVQTPAGANPLVEVSTGGQSFGNFNGNLLLSSFKYKSEAGGGGGGIAQDECAVCLSVFEEGEEVRTLPRCKHSFHAPCIDMWLYSHSDCPLCRAPVGSWCQRHPVYRQPANSRGGLLDSSISV